jgi:hypothetical protein
VEETYNKNYIKICLKVPKFEERHYSNGRVLLTRKN